MTTTNSEFEALFRACFCGEAPWQAVADWVLERKPPGSVRGSLWIPGEMVVELVIYEPAGSARKLAYHFMVPALGISEGKELEWGSFGAGFPALIASEVQILENLLRSRWFLQPGEKLTVAKERV